MTGFLRLLSGGVFALALSTNAAAFVIYDEFGGFADATWGGQGIPNDAVAASKQIVNGTDTIRIAMSATERFFNAAVSDNGAALYTAGKGQNCGATTDPLNCPSANQGALWNWNFFIDIDSTDGGVLTDYQIDLWYDLEAGASRSFGDLSGLGRINITAALIANGTPDALVIEDSQNNLFDFLATDIAGIVDAPDAVFDPSAEGFYQYAITVSQFGFPVDQVAMEVQVVPIPAAAWLFGSALIGLGWMRRRQN